jgi:uncharacterized membrane protein YesL
MNTYSSSNTILTPSIEYYTSFKLNFTNENLLFANMNIVDTQLTNNSSLLVEKLSNLVFIKNDVLKIVNFLPNVSVNNSLEHLEL